jgi:hypothetical protein
LRCFAVERIQRCEQGPVTKTRLGRVLKTMEGPGVCARILVTKCVDDERNESCAPGGSGERPP